MPAEDQSDVELSEENNDDTAEPSGNASELKVGRNYKATRSNERKNKGNMINEAGDGEEMMIDI